MKQVITITATILFLTACNDHRNHVKNSEITNDGGIVDSSAGHDVHTESSREDSLAKAQLDSLERAHHKKQ